ncbi:MAG: hypothetical protein ACRDRO_13010 [Pseudonocardiaceae bacterium]
MVFPVAIGGGPRMFPDKDGRYRRPVLRRGMMEPVWDYSQQGDKYLRRVCRDPAKGR